MADLTQRQESSALVAYKELLQSQWTRTVACQDQCYPPEKCQCLRHIIHVEALASWLGKKISELSGRTNLHRLLEELQLGEGQTFPLEYETYFARNFHCHRVFSLLLKQDRGHLIDRFYKSQMYDMRLDQDGSEENLRENLSEVITDSDEVNGIVRDFQTEKWAYCPLELQLCMDRHLQGTRMVLPFCHKIRLNNKGGTVRVN
jgi:hypothetical protein